MISATSRNGEMGVKVLEAFVEKEDTRIVIHSEQLKAQIRDMVVIVKDYHQRPLLSAISGVTIPYYLVGLDDAIEQELRTYFADMIFEATFNHSTEHHYIAGLKTARYPKKSKRLQDWINHAPVFCQAERDWLFEWCNPVVIQRYGQDDGKTLAAFGAGLYIGGRWYDKGLTCIKIMDLLCVNNQTHKIIFKRG